MPIAISDVGRAVQRRDGSRSFVRDVYVNSLVTQVFTDTGYAPVYTNGYVNPDGVTQSAGDIIFLGNRDPLGQPVPGYTTTIPPALTQSIDLMFIGDSTIPFGRGASATPVNVNTDGARALCVPTKLRDYLIAAGYNASSESWNEGTNTGATLPLYDPRVTLGAGWTVLGSGAAGSSGQCIGGRLIQNTTETVTLASFQPSTQVKNFEVYIASSGAGTIALAIDGGAETNVVVTGTTFQKYALNAASLGNHTISHRRVSGSCYLVGGRAYDPAKTEIRIINMGTRGSSTFGWIAADQPYRPLTALATIAAQKYICNLGINDMINLTLDQFKTNYATLITAILATNPTATPANVLALMVPTPIDAAQAVNFTALQCRTAIYELAATFGLTVIDTPVITGTRAQMDARGQSVDTLHFNATLMDFIAQKISPIIQSTLL